MSLGQPVEAVCEEFGDYLLRECIETGKLVGMTVIHAAATYNRPKEQVNSPKHYQIGGIETIDIIKTMLTPEEYKGYLKGNIIKYRERAGRKGDAETDHAKARWHYERIEQ